MDLLYRALRFVGRLLKLAAIRVYDGVRAVVAKPWISLGTAAAVAALGTLLIGTILRVFDPIPLMVVGPFEVPATKEPAIDGKTLSNILVDELQDIIQNGNNFQGLNALSSHKQYGKLPNTPEIPIQTSFGLEFKGISLDEVRNAWKHLRYHQQLVDGDLIPNANGGAVLVLRLSSKGEANHWEAPVAQPIDYPNLKTAMTYLAVQLMSDMNPEITGRYYLSQDRAEDALPIFSSWASHQSTRPEPYYYMALSMEGWHRPRRDEGELLARKAVSLDPSYHRAIGLIATFEGYRSDDKDAISDNRAAIKLARLPNYLSNLAVDYESQAASETDQKAKKADYDSAIAYARQALREDPEMAVADYVLGRNLRNEGDIKAAIDAMNDALRLRPDYFAPLQDLTNILIGQRRFDEAIKACRTSVLLNRRVSDPQKKELAEPLQYLGRALIAAGQEQDGIGTLEQAFEINPDLPGLRIELAEALLNQAKSFIAKGDLKSAALYNAEAARANPAASAKQVQSAEKVQRRVNQQRQATQVSR